MNLYLSYFLLLSRPVLWLLLQICLCRAVGFAWSRMSFTTCVWLISSSLIATFGVGATWWDSQFSVALEGVRLWFVVSFNRSRLFPINQAHSSFSFNQNEVGIAFIYKTDIPIDNFKRRYAPGYHERVNHGLHNRHAVFQSNLKTVYFCDIQWNIIFLYCS